MDKVPWQSTTDGTFGGADNQGVNGAE